jgi:hypothetical protein
VTTDRWRREALYHEMLAHPEDERAAALAAACPGDAALQAEVRSLLDQPQPTARFLVISALEFAAHLVSPAALIAGPAHGVCELQGLLGVGDGRSVPRAAQAIGPSGRDQILPRARTLLTGSPTSNASARARLAQIIHTSARSTCSSMLTVSTRS